MATISANAVQGIDSKSPATRLRNSDLYFFEELSSSLGFETARLWLEGEFLQSKYGSLGKSISIRRPLPSMITSSDGVFYPSGSNSAASSPRCETHYSHLLLRDMYKCPNLRRQRQTTSVPRCIFSGHNSPTSTFKMSFAADLLRTSRRLEHAACAATALRQHDHRLGLLFTDAAHIVLDSDSPTSASDSASAFASAGRESA